MTYDPSYDPLDRHDAPDLVDDEETAPCASCGWSPTHLFHDGTVDHPSTHPYVPGPPGYLELQKAWSEWRARRPWTDGELPRAIKVGEEAGEVLGAAWKREPGHADTHPEHTKDKLLLEMGQLMGALMCLADELDADLLALAFAELTAVRVRFGD